MSEAHVLTHLARNADGLRNLLLAARSGIPLRRYASPRARAADIDAGATRAADVIVDDVLESTRRFAAEVAAMDLALEFAFGDVEEDIATTLVHRYIRRCADQGTTGGGVQGPLRDRLAWLAGRGGGEGLRAAGDGPVPALPNLG